MSSQQCAPSNPQLAAAVEFIWREATLLDRKDYQAWLALWDPAGKYVVPIEPETTDFEATLNYVYDDQAMLAKRIERMTSGFSVSAVDSATTVRSASRFTLVSSQAGVVDVDSVQIVVAHKRGVNTIFASDMSYRIRLDQGEPKLEQKVIRLLDTADSISAIGFLL